MLADIYQAPLPQKRPNCVLQFGYVSPLQRVGIIYIYDITNYIYIHINKIQYMYACKYVSNGPTSSLWRSLAILQAGYFQQLPQLRRCACIACIAHMFNVTTLPCQELPLWTPCMLIIIGDAQRDDVIPARLSFARILSRSTTSPLTRATLRCQAGWHWNTAWTRVEIIPYPSLLFQNVPNHDFFASNSVQFEHASGSKLVLVGPGLAEMKCPCTYEVYHKQLRSPLPTETTCESRKVS